MVESPGSRLVLIATELRLLSDASAQVEQVPPLGDEIVIPPAELVMLIPLPAVRLATE
jgi:hypothetical protein